MYSIYFLTIAENVQGTQFFILHRFSWKNVSLSRTVLENAHICIQSLYKKKLWPLLLCISKCYIKNFPGLTLSVILNFQTLSALLPALSIFVVILTWSSSHSLHFNVQRFVLFTAYVLNCSTSSSTIEQKLLIWIKHIHTVRNLKKKLHDTHVHVYVHCFI